MKVLIVYGTTEGHTRKISERIASRIGEIGHESQVYDSGSLPAELDVAAYGATIVAASVHQGHYQASLVHFAKENVKHLAAKPSAFVSVSLASVFFEGQEDAQGYVDQFLTETGWRPSRIELVAGALVYTKYDFFKRQIMKFIVRKGGGPTDAGQDYEFTDWEALSRFVDSFVEILE